MWTSLLLGCASEPVSEPEPAPHARLIDGLESERASLTHDAIAHLRDAVRLEGPLPVQLPPNSQSLRFHAAGEGSLTVLGSEPELTVELTPTWTEHAIPLPVGAAQVTFTPSVPGALLATPRVEPLEESDRLNVLLIGVDTLRPDRTSAFGYARDTTPHLAALADEGTRFTQARSQAPWTLPSFSSILTSLYPSRHGAGRGGHDQWTGIDPTTLALSEVLAEHGYETQAMIANLLIGPKYGLDQGFEGFRSHWGGEAVLDDAAWVADWVAGHERTPWFFFWHIMETHLPYESAPEVRDRFVDPNYEGRYDPDASPAVPFRTLDPRPGRRWFVHEGPPPPPDLSDADRQFVHDSYDAELAEMDAALGEVFERLKRSGQWERTVVAVVADHGEGLGDHDHYHHGYTLFDDQVRIPMLVRVPGQEPGSVDRPVAGIDLAPTVLGRLGIDVPEVFQGVDRLAADAPTDDPYVIEYPSYDSSAQKALVSGRFKYLHDPWFGTEALYDLESDPAERTDIAALNPDVVATARATLDAFRLRELDRGRYHLVIPGGSLSITTDGLFDANFITQPAIDRSAWELDLDRQELTIASEGPLELAFWLRGETMTWTLDGEAHEVDLGAVTESEGQPEGHPLWLEAGAAPAEPVVLDEDALEMLRTLGYVD